MSLEKNISETRRDSANNIRSARKADRESLYKNDREFSRYNINIKGLSGTFNYTSNLPSRVILDVGVGRGIAFRQIKEIASSYGLTVFGTSLTKLSEIDGVTPYFR